MRIAVFGLGYVGSVTSACLARDGRHVVGVDVKPEKVQAIQNGRSPIIEPGLSALIRQATIDGRLEATHDVDYAVQTCDIVMVCVGTPSLANGDLDLSYVEHVCGEIGRSLATKKAYTTIVIRSTMLPGSAQERIVPILAAESGRTPGDDFGFCINPEFLREGSAISDFDNPPFTLVGALDARSAEHLEALYRHLPTPLYQVQLGEAEMVKYASNAFHALKVVFANEIGNICKVFGLDSHIVMDIFAQDTKLNLSPYYLKPGFAFGGSCLPKDLRALLYAARRADLPTPVLEAILPSNRQQIEMALDILVRDGKRKISLVGLSFKPSTDDLRESPAIELAERLLGKGFDLAIYDREVFISQIHGSNRQYIDRLIPHLSSLMCASLADAVTSADTIVVAKQPTADEYAELLQLLRPDQTVIDLVRMNGQLLPQFGGGYYGLAW